MQLHLGFATRCVEEQSCASFAQDDEMDSDAFSAARTPSPGRISQGRGMCTISSNDAVLIFNSAKHDCTKRDRLANRFAKEFGITSKAVRDIWNLRTWAGTTKPFWSPSDEAHFLKREHRKNTKRVSMKQSVAKKAPPQENDVPTISMTADSFFWTQGSPQCEISDCSVPRTAIPNVCPQSPATIAAHADLRNSKNRRFFDGEWMIEPSFIAQDFEDCFLEWSNVNPTFTLGYDVCQ
jgi:hypothetical protein